MPDKNELQIESEILAKPKGSIGFVKSGDDIVSTWFRAHDETNGKGEINQGVYLTRSPIKNFLVFCLEIDLDLEEESTKDLEFLPIWFVTQEGLTPIIQITQEMRESEYEDLLDIVVDELEELEKDFPIGTVIFEGDLSTGYSDFAFALKTTFGWMTSSCGPDITTENMDNIFPSDCHVETFDYILPVADRA